MRTARCREIPAVKPASKKGRRRLMGATLLIADGESPSRDALAGFFAQCGFQVEIACDGLECLFGVRALEPDVLVVDCELPWGGAAAIVAFLNETHFEFEMPAVLVVGHASPAVLSGKTGVPESACFQKPVATERLLDWVGLAVALVYLRGNGEPPPDRRRLGHPHAEKTCLARAT
jgi:DNA-binding NtrC family response regulator